MRFKKIKIYILVVFRGRHAGVYYTFFSFTLVLRVNKFAKINHNNNGWGEVILQLIIYALHYNCSIILKLKKKIQYYFRISYKRFYHKHIVFFNYYNYKLIKSGIIIATDLHEILFLLHSYSGDINITNLGVASYF